MADKPTPEELKRRYEEYRERAIAAFPFEQIECPGDQALSTWQGLVTSGRGAPVVVGDYDAFVRIAEMVPELPGFVRENTPEILQKAVCLRHPVDLINQRANEMEKARELIQQRRETKPGAPLPDFLKTIFPDMPITQPNREDLIAAMSADYVPEVGEWPTEAPVSPGLSVAADFRSGEPLALTYIILVPTDDWTTIPAHLRWGNWNGCPAPEYHVAALRSWRDRFGAELVGLSSDVMNIRVRHRPKSRGEALELAREQYSYCSDIVDQGVGTLNALAAGLMENDWWYFWWD
jgi:hypothetical protein